MLAAVMRFTEIASWTLAIFIVVLLGIIAVTVRWIDRSP